MRISVIGTGYLGATHAACLAAWGHHVVGVETNSDRLALLSEGMPPFHEPGLEPLLRDGLDSGRLGFTSDLAEISRADVHFICVGTPQGDGMGSPDLSALYDVARAVQPWVQPGSLVVGKSTVPVGTARKLSRSLPRVAWNPEFLREGQAVQDTLAPERLVFGVERAEDERVLREVYAPLVEAGVPAVCTDLETAELAKVSANLLLASRISFINVLAETCEASGADVDDLMTIIGLDSRIGSKVLTPGIGYGGGCLPKDSRAFAQRADELGVFGARALVDDVDGVNQHQGQRAIDIVAGMLGGSVQGSRITVLGAAFKAGTDDVRESPALAVAVRLLDAGAKVSVYDPEALDNVRRSVPQVPTASGVRDACRDADAVMVLTEWDEFRGLDPVDLHDMVRAANVVDGRQILDAAKWRAAGWEVHVLGRGRNPG